MLTENDTPDLIKVRQLETLGFRAWPAAQIIHEGSWAVQLTPYYPSKRGNSVNLLDPADHADMELRVEKCEALLVEQGCQPVFRLTALAPPGLAPILNARGYIPTRGSVVMACDLRDNAGLSAGSNKLPLRLVYFRDGQEPGYSRVSAVLHGRDDSQIEGLAEVVRSIKSQKFAIAGFVGAEAAANMLCVSDEGFTGLFDLCIAEDFRRRGFAKALVLHAMREALQRGDHTFWLQVEADNAAACTLYQGLGFKTAYKYVYYCKSGEA